MVKVLVLWRRLALCSLYCHHIPRSESPYYCNDYIIFITGAPIDLFTLTFPLSAGTVSKSQFAIWLHTVSPPSDPRSYSPGQL